MWCVCVCRGKRATPHTSTSVPREQIQEREDMCSSTADAKVKKKAENSALHVSPPMSPSSPTVVKSEDCLSDRSSNNKGASRSHYADLSDTDDEGDRDETTNSMTFSLPKKIDSLLLDDGDENEPGHPDSSLIVNNIEHDSRINKDRDAHAEVQGSNFCAELLPGGVCQEMDIFMRCQHPLDILAMFHEDEVAGMNGDSINHSYAGDMAGETEVHRVSGYHAIPRSCEYCGSKDIELCRENPECQLPKTFFPRERPPFCSKGKSKWKEEKRNATIPSNGDQNDAITESNGDKDDAITESDENIEKRVATMACSAWI